MCQRDTISNADLSLLYNVYIIGSTSTILNYPWDQLSCIVPRRESGNFPRNNHCAFAE